MEKDFKKEERVAGAMSDRSQRPRISSKERRMVGCVDDDDEDDDETFPKQNWTAAKGNPIKKSISIVISISVTSLFSLSLARQDGLVAQRL